jgi:benzoyl-CoA reductase subunit D
MKEEMVEQKVDIEVANHPDSMFAGAIGAALWGSFRHEKLAALDQLAQAS